MAAPDTPPQDDLVPWEVAKRHRWSYPVLMLRTEARRRAGEDPTATMGARLDRWTAMLRHDDLVVAYDPLSEDGFAYVPRRPGIDTDLVRAPG